MVEKCANPACSAPFDYRQGRLYFRPLKLLDGSPPASYHGVEHYWLCASCSKTYSFEPHAMFAVVTVPCSTTQSEGQLLPLRPVSPSRKGNYGLILHQTGVAPFQRAWKDPDID
jgi:hypothetical protein